jgi:hypothetical protein
MKLCIETDTKPVLGFSNRASGTPDALFLIMKHNSDTLAKEMALTSKAHG